MLTYVHLSGLLQVFKKDKNATNRDENHNKIVMLLSPLKDWEQKCLKRFSQCFTLKGAITSVLSFLRSAPEITFLFCFVLSESLVPLCSLAYLQAK